MKGDCCQLTNDESKNIGLVRGVRQHVSRESMVEFY
jgi:hypothetical protein